jgi:hypothetical protein
MKGVLIVSEREREREDAPHEPTLGEKLADALRGRLKLRDDTTSEERYINRSLKIRRLVLAWMTNNVDQSFESWEEMGGLAGNYCQRMGLKDGASSTCCIRWIHQLSLTGELFRIESQPSGYIVRVREEGAKK